MNEQIFVIYYAHRDQPVQLIKAFHSQRRAQAYLAMLRNAPFPDQRPSGYVCAPLQLN